MRLRTLACELARVDLEEVVFQDVADFQVGDGVHGRDAGTRDDRAVDQNHGTVIKGFRRSLSSQGTFRNCISSGSASRVIRPPTER